LPPLKPHQIANELRYCDRDIEEVIGRHTTLMRPPGDDMNSKVLHVAKALGYVTVSYTVGAKDFGQDPPVASIVQRVLSGTEPGGIILLHQTSHATLEALPTIIDALKARGYRFVTISQMLTREHARLPPQPVVGQAKQIASR
jgi:peptidoglycan/xylan/chitin deacetylase (PgdA/CDA1 family)